MNDKRVRVTAIILAAGQGSRMKADITKQRMKILSETVLCHTVRAFSECPLVDHIVLVSREDEIDEIKRELLPVFSKIGAVVIGGNCRAESAKLGFEAIPKDTDFVAIHDGARCLITPEMITSVVENAKKYGAATAASRVVSTLKRVGDDGFVSETYKRDSFFLAQTPQIFAVEKYRRALALVPLSAEITDDNMLMEAIGERVFCVDTGDENLKITTRNDLLLAEYIIKRRKGDVM